MKREIKFRAWHKNECYYEYLELQTYNFGSMRGLIDQNIGLEDAEWEQYTGLKDKNGKEIYEGDILLNTRHGNKAVVEYSTDTVSKHGIVSDGFGGKMDLSGFFNTLGAFKLRYVNKVSKAFHLQDTEIIGNIHEERES